MMNEVVFEGFDDITKDDIINAIKEYDELEEKSKLDKNRLETNYKLVYNGKEYPPKYIVGIAYGLKHNTVPLKASLYNSTGKHKKAAQWCLENNGFILNQDKKYIYN